MIRIAVCDDNREELNRITKILDELALIFPELLVESFLSGEEFLEHYQKMCPAQLFDLIFLDIHLGEINGLYLAREIRKRDGDVLIVYLTAHPEYVFGVFDTNPLDFLCKPAPPTLVHAVFRRAYDKLKQRRALLFFQQGRDMLVFPVARILYFDCYGGRITIHMLDGTEEFRGKKNALLAKIPREEFLPIHNHYIVNMRFIQKLRNAVTLQDKITLPISRTYAQSAKMEFARYLTRGEIG